MRKTTQAAVLTGVLLGSLAGSGDRTMEAAPRPAPAHADPFEAFSNGNEFYDPDTSGDLPPVACAALAQVRFLLGPFGRGSDRIFGDERGTYGDVYVDSRSLRAGAEVLRATLVDGNGNYPLPTGVPFAQAPMLRAVSTASAVDAAGATVGDLERMREDGAVSDAEQRVAAASVVDMLNQARLEAAAAYKAGCNYMDPGVINNPLVVKGQ